jgi:hypothetical protein
MRCACATTPGAWYLWAATTAVLAFALLAVGGHLWPVLREAVGATVLVAAGVGCVITYSKNCTYHCRLTRPLFLAAGAILILGSLNVQLLPAPVVWSLTVVGTMGAFWLEARHTRRTSN